MIAPCTPSHDSKANPAAKAPQDRPQGVHRIDRADILSHLAHGTHVCLAGEGKGRPHQQSWNEHHRERRLEHLPDVAEPARGLLFPHHPQTLRLQGSSQHQHARQRRQADEDLHHGERPDRIAVPVHELAGGETAQGQPQQEGAQHGAEGVGRIAHEEHQQPRPDHFVPPARRNRKRRRLPGSTAPCPEHRNAAPVSGGAGCASRPLLAITASSRSVPAATSRLMTAAM